LGVERERYNEPTVGKNDGVASGKNAKEVNEKGRHFAGLL